MVQSDVACVTSRLILYRENFSHVKNDCGCNGIIITWEACICLEFRISFSPLHFYLPHLLQKCRPADIQLLSNPCNFWKRFLIHNELVLKQEFICEYCLSFLSKNVDCAHELFLSVSATNKNRADSGLDTGETSRHMQIISSLLNTSYIVVIKNTAVWAMASFCMQ